MVGLLIHVFLIRCAFHYNRYIPEYYRAQLVDGLFRIFFSNTTKWHVFRKVLTYRNRISIQKNPSLALLISDFFKKQFGLDLNNFGQFLNHKKFHKKFFAKNFHFGFCSIFEISNDFTNIFSVFWKNHLIWVTGGDFLELT